MFSLKGLFDCLSPKDVAKPLPVPQAYSELFLIISPIAGDEFFPDDQFVSFTCIPAELQGDKIHSGMLATYVRIPKQEIPSVTPELMDSLKPGVWIECTTPAGRLENMAAFDDFYVTDIRVRHDLGVVQDVPREEDLLTAITCVSARAEAEAHPTRDFPLPRPVVS